MNLIPKMTFLSFLGVTAFGAGAFSGCSKDDPPTSGTRDASFVVVPPDETVSNPGTTKDSKQCESAQDADFMSPECQACLDRSCCTELQTCFDLSPADGSKVDCNGYASCVDDCTAKKTQKEQQQCYDECDVGAADGISTAFSGIEDCALSHCKTPCGG
jgi:hypothetical protein